MIQVQKSLNISKFIGKISTQNDLSDIFQNFKCFTEITKFY